MTTEGLVIGTRGSLLAMAQSRQVAELIRRAEPGVAVDFLAVETRGDRDQSTPLAEANDPGFFSHELHDALQRGRVDLLVHSLKDLPLQCPEEIVRVAFPLRDNPRDVVLFHPRVEGKLSRGEPIRVGSSSSRRRHLTEKFLGTALPNRGRPARLRFADLRGSVENRVAQLFEGSAVLDGAILALAGLNRLWIDPEGRRRLEPLLESLRFMVLPLTECPSAPGQGVLAVECRSTDRTTRSLLAALDDAVVRAAVEREFGHWRAHGLGAELGVTVESHPTLGELLFAGKGLEFGNRLPKPCDPKPFDGGQLPAQRRALSPVVLGNLPGAPLFLAHWAALPEAIKLPQRVRIWVSGVSSWQRIARRGLWVEGCAENLGFDFLARTLRAPALRLPAIEQWTVLTHRDAIPGWHQRGMVNAAASYEIAPVDSTNGMAQTVAAATHFFWGTRQQFDTALPWLPDGAHHACGPGKTSEYLKARGIQRLALFPSRREWQQWLA